MPFQEPLPDHLVRLYSRSEIEARLDALAQMVDRWSEEARDQSGQPLLAVCLLRGGVFFFSDVLLRLSYSVEPGFCRAWSYRKHQNGQPADNCRLDWQELVMRDRSVLLIDNLCDSGRTLAVAREEAERRGAAQVRTLVLIERERADSLHRPTLSGFSYAGPEWLAGYGLRDGDLWMNCPEVFRIVAGLRT